MNVAATINRPKVHVIDVDTHLSEPHDLWLKRAPASLKDRVPQVKTLNGVHAWFIDGGKQLGGPKARAVSSVRKDGRKAFGEEWEELGINDCHTASWETRSRVQFMDESNVWAQVIYPNILGFGGQRSAQVDRKLRLAVVQIYNDAMAEMQRDSGDRIFPMALLPWWDVKEAVAETERCVGMGLRGININSDPHTARMQDTDTLPDLSDPYWDPLWEICQDKNLPVNFHIGASDAANDFFGSGGWPRLTGGMKIVAGSAMLYFNNARVLANIILSGLLDRFPKLTFVSVESGVGWVPFMLEALDHQYSEFTQHNALQMKPSEYFSRNFYATYWFEQRRLVEDIRAVGVDRVMFETDFPHPTCLYPAPDFDTVLPGLSFEEQAKVLSLNAAKVYGIKLPA